MYGVGRIRYPAFGSSIRGGFAKKVVLPSLLYHSMRGQVLEDPGQEKLSGGLQVVHTVRSDA